MALAAGSHNAERRDTVHSAGRFAGMERHRGSHALGRPQQRVAGPTQHCVVAPARRRPKLVAETL